MKVVVIIPTYNEKGNIEKLINILEEEVFPGIKNHNMNILIADDNSPDGTEDEVRKLMKKWKNLDINSGKKMGLGAAYIRAMSYAIEKGADVMFELDADLQHDPAKIPLFLQKIDEGYDMVIGTRYSQGGSIPAKWPIQRKMFSVLGNLIVRIILLRFSVHDWTGGYRAVRKEVFIKEKPELTNFKGYTFQVSFLNKAVRDGFKIAEIPFHFGERHVGSSKIAPLAYIMDLLKYVIKASLRERIFGGTFGKFLVVGGTGFLIQVIVYRFIITSTTFPLGIANLISAQLAIFSNYNLNNLWTFKREKSGNKFIYFAKMLGFFATSNTGVIIIQSGLIQLGEVVFGREFPLPYVYFVLATGVLLIYNFSMYRFVIWRKKPHK